MEENLKTFSVYCLTPRSQESGIVKDSAFNVFVALFRFFLNIKFSLFLLSFFFLICSDKRKVNLTKLNWLSKVSNFNCSFQFISKVIMLHFCEVKRNGKNFLFVEHLPRIFTCLFFSLELCVFLLLFFTGKHRFFSIEKNQSFSFLTVNSKKNTNGIKKTEEFIYSFKGILTKKTSKYLKTFLQLSSVLLVFIFFLGLFFYSE